MLLFLSIFLATLSVVNKLLLAFDRRSGWISGVVIGLLSTIYFYCINLRILSVAELGFFLVMLYGYLTNTRPSQRQTLAINIIISGVSAMLCYFAFAGYLTVIQAISSVAFIWGGYLLTTTYRRFGWVSFIVAHLGTSIASYYVQQFVFSDLQIVSAMVCVYVLIYRRKIQLDSHNR
jgi:hypothetical protein